MQRDQRFSVVGFRENGDGVVITKETTHQTAERVMSLMTGGSSFAELFIEADGEGETPGVDCGALACDEPVPAAFAETK